jgi:hypothetical protein
MGDSIYTNPMMLGYAWQKGWIPAGRESSLMRAMELNAVAVEQNKAAFEWGRRAAHDWATVQRLLAPAQVIEFKQARNAGDHGGAPCGIPDRLPECGLCRDVQPSSNRSALAECRWARRR